MNWRSAPPLFVGAIAALAAVTTASDVQAQQKLWRVVLDAGNPGKTLAQGYSTIEQATVDCPYQSCSVGMRIMANVGSATCKSQWAIVGLVDGNSVDGGPLLESLPNAGDTQTHIWQGHYTATGGTHTVTFELYLPCAANINQWSVRYVITYP